MEKSKKLFKFNLGPMKESEYSNSKDLVIFGLPCTLPDKGDNRNTTAISHSP